jgi:hypothetical protein
VKMTTVKYGTHGNIKVPASAARPARLVIGWDEFEDGNFEHPERIEIEMLTFVESEPAEPPAMSYGEWLYGVHLRKG